MKANTLSYAFWANVYDQPHLSREELIALFAIEPNPAVQQIPSVNSQGEIVNT